MKCCDSGLARRQKASQMLYEHLDEHYDEHSNIIVLGDWNDDTKDNPGEHCFEPFFDDDRFYFTTHDITYDINQAKWKAAKQWSDDHGYKFLILTEKQLFSGKK